MQLLGGSRKWTCMTPLMRSSQTASAQLLSEFRHTWARAPQTMVDNQRGRCATLGEQLATLQRVNVVLALFRFCSVRREQPPIHVILLGRARYLNAGCPVRTSSG